MTILYDTVTVKGWAVDIRTHRIGEIINKVLADPWPGTEDARDQNVAASSLAGSARSQGQAKARGGTVWNWWGWGRKGPKGGGGAGGDDGDDDGDGWEKHGGVPKPESERDCVDCFKW